MAFTSKLIPPRAMKDSMHDDAVASTLQFYRAHAREYFKRTVDADLSDAYDRFLRLLRPGGRILDAGCGSGRDLRAFRQRGYDVLGIDASPELVELARTYSGAECQVSRFEDITFSGHFDGVWACASLLHVPRQSLEDILRRFRTALMRGGVLFASVQMGEGERVDQDGRFFASYGEGDFPRIVEDAGFSLMEVWLSSDSLSQRRSIEWLNVIARS